MREVGPYLVTAATTVRDALEKLDATGAGVLLLTDVAGRLLRTVTDGDIRRLILAGTALETTLDTLPRLSSTVVSAGTTAEAALRLLNERKLDQLPVVD